MVNQRMTDSSTRVSNSSKPSNIHIWLHGTAFKLDKKLLAAKSGKLAVLFREKSDEEICHFLRDIVGDTGAFELVARFCYGLEIHMCAENVVPLICLAHYLEMTDNHGANNLLGKALAFFEQRILPCWNETIKALRIQDNVLKQATHLGLIKACIDSVIEKASADPHLLGEAISSSTYGGSCEDGDEDYKPNVRRRLFVSDLESESLITLPLRIYEPIIEAMNKNAIPSEYVAGSLCEYVKHWVLTNPVKEENMSLSMRNTHREIIEKVERLLPDKRGLLPSTLLFELLRVAIDVEASSDCRSRFETRIGKQLDHASVKDLLIPSQGYSKEAQYDVETVRRILKHFYSNYNNSDVSGLIKVAELVEQFLVEVASDMDLNMETFIMLAEISVAASSGIPRNSDGLYQAISIYFNKHTYLTESEREVVCKVLDCNKLSPEACKYAARNEKLPLRVVVQVLFVGQLQLRDVIMNDVQDTEKESENEDKASIGYGREEGRTEVDKMNDKVMELEKECLIMKKEFERSCRTSIWREMKRRFGCIGNKHEYCHEVMRKKKMPFKQRE